MPDEKCLDCLKEITEKAILFSTKNTKLQKELQDELFLKIDKQFQQIKLPEFSTELFADIAAHTGILDPFLDIKIKSNLEFKKISPIIEKEIMSLSYPEKLNTLFLFAIGANMVDFSTGGHSIEIDDIARIILEFPQEDLKINDFDKLWVLIQSSKKIIYLSDNCGEVVIDNLIVEQLVKDLKLEVYFGLKDGPIANDCTLDDFSRDNLPFVATETFAVSSSFGWNLDQSTMRFKELLEEADLLIVKGQSNYETTLNNLLRYPDYKFPPIFCILRTKCQVITKHLGVPLGSNIIKQMYPLSENEMLSLTEIVDCD
jgi:uncharacterized protein with ATP-grasp and redox domains